MNCFIRFCFFVFCFIFFSCSGKNTTDVQEEKVPASRWTKLLEPFRPEPGIAALSPEDYVSWVHAQTGITYSSVTNDQFDVSLTFHPPVLEAYTSCVNNGEDPEKALAAYTKIQKDYYYCDVSCLVKYESASDPIRKTDLLNLLKQQLTVVKNNTDTLTNVIAEPFPSYVMNQPNKLLVMIPADSLSSYQITLSGSKLHLKDVQLNLSSTDIQSFPIIKL